MGKLLIFTLLGIFRLKGAVMIRRLMILLAFSMGMFPVLAAEPVITGELKKWHKITLTFDGPQADEKGAPNPFLDYRLNVSFTKGTKSFLVPGYFAADGDAGNTGATTGNKWRVHFAPDETGEWTYLASFRTGSGVAVDAGANAGSAVAAIDGQTGKLTIAASDKTGRDHRAKGRLRYVGKHHLQFAETGEYFMKQGADSPENLLAFADFDDTPNNGGRLKTYAPHIKDWQAGNPTWKGGKGKGLIGAINYLASEEMNAFSFLTYNVGGDDKNVFPMISDKAADRTRYDCSKLDQWEVVFEHGDHMGMYLHFKLQERENDGGHATKGDVALDNGNLGVQRKLYIRELVARFSHHLALNWNLGEENEQTTAQQRDMIGHIAKVDPYGHNRVLHTTPGAQNKIYGPLLGDKSEMTGVSLQGGDNSFNDLYPWTVEWVNKSAAANKPWVVANDEQGKGNQGIFPDQGNADGQNTARKKVIWANLLAGGAGCEYYFGYQYDHSDLTLQDFRSRDKWWDYARHLLHFLKKGEIPFWNMRPDNSVITGAGNWSLGKPGDAYVIYLPNGGTTQLDLSAHNGKFNVSWFDPIKGGELQSGSVKQVTGGGKVSIGNAPGNASQDWAVYVANSNLVSIRPGLSARSSLSSPEFRKGLIYLSPGPGSTPGFKVYSISGKEFFLKE